MSEQRTASGFWPCFLFLLLIGLVFCGKSVPFNNEFVYLLRLEPDFLLNDWAFSRPANEHWLFNTIFGSLGYFFSIEVIGWAGRLLSWSLCLGGVILLGRRWEIPFWSIAASIVVWLAAEQSIANGEWVFGTFEAKTIAYASLLFSLFLFTERRVTLPAVLLGLTFSFHPAVGLWAIPATGIALLIGRVRASDLTRIVLTTFVFSLPGLVAVLLDQGVAGAPTADDWKFVLTKLMPYHFDAFSFSRREMAVMFLMLGFNFSALIGDRDFGRRLLLNFQLATAVFFVLGVLFRWFELYPLLSYMPMRLFPTLTPLFFLYTVFFTFQRVDRRVFKAAVLLFAVGVVGSLNPVAKGYSQVSETYTTWTKTPDDMEISLRWISQNTPPDATILAPPRSRTNWYYSRRAQIAAYPYPRYDRLGEWRQRFHDLTAGVELADRGDGIAQIDPAYDSLTKEQIVALSTKYSAVYLVSRTFYDFPILFETATVRVYRIP